MTREELEREEVKAQSNVEVSVDSKHQTMSGIAFPFTEPAKDALAQYKAEKTNYVMLKIDTSKEIIDLADKKICDVKSLPSKVPEDAPRYHIFRFDHTHEGDFQKSTSKCERAPEAQATPLCLLYHSRKIISDCQIHIYVIGWN